MDKDDIKMAVAEQRRKRKEAILDIISGILHLIVVIGIPILLVLGSLAINYWIATSDLPGWFKFYLLQKG